MGGHGPVFGCMGCPGHRLAMVPWRARTPGNLLALPNEWWCPYLQIDNASIERRFAAGAESLELPLEAAERTLRIKFTPGQTFGLQTDERRGKERTIRRVIRTIQDLKIMLDCISTPPIDPSELAEIVPPGTIPHHFFCPITQDIMQDPVKTVDGMTYDRPAIDRWLHQHTTSPLTGLPLSTRNVTPHISLREQIQEWVKKNAHLMTPQATPQVSSANLLAGRTPASQPDTAAQAVTLLAQSSVSSQH